MVKKYISGNFAITISVSVLLFIITSIRYFDAEIAVRIMNFIKSFHTLHTVTDNIPDILLPLVGIATILLWSIYLYRWYKKKYGRKSQFLQLAATALPVVYLLKSFFQIAFGRTSVRVWLIQGQPLEFDWFNGFVSGSFPSGHMTVFAAFGTAVLIYYPQYRWLVLTMLISLGIALIATDYHFLSDVIAGACLGFITVYTLWYMFEKHRNKYRNSAERFMN
jgi:membrane-associated phospholipid phosphatase